MHTITDWLQQLKDSDKLIIVEGINDKAALNRVGIKKERIMTLNKPLFDIVELAAKKSKKIIILTDLDIQGKKLYRRLKTDLAKLGVEIDNKFREFLFRHTKLSHIEGIDTYISNQLNDKKTL